MGCETQAAYVAIDTRAVCGHVEVGVGHTATNNKVSFTLYLCVRAAFVAQEYEPLPLGCHTPAPSACVDQETRCKLWVMALVALTNTAATPIAHGVPNRPPTQMVLTLRSGEAVLASPSDYLFYSTWSGSVEPTAFFSLHCETLEHGHERTDLDLSPQPPTAQPIPRTVPRTHVSARGRAPQRRQTAQWAKVNRRVVPTSVRPRFVLSLFRAGCGSIRGMARGTDPDPGPHPASPPKVYIHQYAAMALVGAS